MDERRVSVDPKRMDIPTFKRVLLRAVKAKYPNATPCGIRTWLVVQRMNFATNIVNQFLEKLQQEGMLEEVSEQKQNCRTNKVYTITDKGEEYVRAA